MYSFFIKIHVICNYQYNLVFRNICILKIKIYDFLYRNKRSLSNEPPEKKARLEKIPVTSMTISKTSTTIPALAVTPNNILPATTTTYAVTPGMSNVAKTPCVMTIANSAPVGLVKPNITASVIAPTNIVKSTAVMSPSPPPLKTQTTTLNKVSHPVISQQPICKPPIPTSAMPPPIKSHLNAINRTPPLPKLLSPKGHIVQAYTSQSIEANNQNSILHPPTTPQSSQPLLVHTPGVMSPPLRGVLNSPSRGVLSPPSRGLLSPPSRAAPQPTPIIHNSSTVPDVSISYLYYLYCCIVFIFTNVFIYFRLFVRKDLILLKWRIQGALL